MTVWLDDAKFETLSIPQIPYIFLLTEVPGWSVRIAI